MRCFHSFDDLEFYVLDLPDADSLKKNPQICVGKNRKMLLDLEILRRVSNFAALFEIKVHFRNAEVLRRPL